MTRFLVALAVIALVAPPLHAHGDAHDKRATAQPMVETDFGRTGDPNKISRTVRIDMSDRMRFSPAVVTAKKGETLKFVAKNSGAVLHEMVLGTMAELKAHAELMRKFPGMEHDDPFMAHVAPGKTGEIVWQFTKAGEFYYGCLIPGHFEAGMIGKVTVK
ncbi:MAG: cupredoxin family protein [Gammaproteobacteria bacterium]|nr:cupredoxin family protein [Gammaproteobacteria bacterium]